MLAAPSPPKIRSKFWRIIPFQKKGNQQSKNVTFFSAILLKMYNVTRSENRPLLSAMILVTQASLVLDHYLEDYLEDQGLVWSQGIQNASGDLGRLVAPPLCHRRKFDTGGGWGCRDAVGQICPVGPCSCSCSGPYFVPLALKPWCCSCSCSSV